MYVAVTGSFCPGITACPYALPHTANRRIMPYKNESNDLIRVIDSEVLFKSILCISTFNFSDILLFQDLNSDNRKRIGIENLIYFFPLDYQFLFDRAY